MTRPSETQAWWLMHVSCCVQVRTHYLDKNQLQPAERAEESAETTETLRGGSTPGGLCCSTHPDNPSLSLYRLPSLQLNHSNEWNPPASDQNCPILVTRPNWDVHSSGVAHLGAGLQTDPLGRNSCNGRSRPSFSSMGGASMSRALMQFARTGAALCKLFLRGDDTSSTDSPADYLRDPHFSGDNMLAGGI
ncbi:uncharacterized protein BO80DRAFT_440898 [Aspergillus ibericus CBS 121593]|uniref:Uncharacterized protein n=1 Tax=Aspergillus ibericus CBS 121593 TaxID=1448316 RepID=A0A395HC74_9EURO|nr:hypothetical protein BO80DRAFT_440898 [Aspergillus ibericus CBS 121593]RAL05310.1 hypothetical protein BO80DRAFT_440898 [Aspergillus ibericus CBS 121593]